ncbi:MAG: hypothetical protein JF619_23395 [Massilia sp.]|nr:hypothetical protein [Massilia sp.]
MRSASCTFSTSWRRRLARSSGMGRSSPRTWPKNCGPRGAGACATARAGPDPPCSPALHTSMTTTATTASASASRRHGRGAARGRSVGRRGRRGPLGRSEGTVHHRTTHH